MQYICAFSGSRELFLVNCERRCARGCEYLGLTNASAGRFERHACKLRVINIEHLLSPISNCIKT